VRFHLQEKGGEPMAEQVKAIYAYTPRVKINRVVEMKEIIIYIGERTGFNKSTILGMLAELEASVLHYTSIGASVRLSGLGLFSPRIDQNGVFSINHVVDRDLKIQLNSTGGFSGTVVNHDMIGKTSHELIDRWNREHPDDPVKVKDKDKK
jgi:hypothetical protein